MYPHELRLMYKKNQNKMFRSLSQIMAFVRMLPENPVRRRFGLMRVVDSLGRFAGVISRNPLNLFLAVVTLVTLVYLGYQLTVRSVANRGVKENTVYAGMQQIGDIHLGEESR